MSPKYVGLLFSTTFLRLAFFFFVLDLFFRNVLFRVGEAETQSESMLLCWLNCLEYATLLQTSLLDKPAFGLKLLFFRKDFAQILPKKRIGSWRGIYCVFNRVSTDLNFILSFSQLTSDGIKFFIILFIGCSAVHVQVLLRIFDWTFFFCLRQDLAYIDISLNYIPIYLLFYPERRFSFEKLCFSILCFFQARFQLLQVA